MKRALIITTVSGFVPQFEMNNVKILQELGYEVHYAANYNMPVYTDNNDRLDGTGIVQHQIDFVRSPYHIRKNIKALRQLVTLMRRVKFSLVHCHTPMGGVLGRIAAHKTNTKPVIYTAHGFHFYTGAPIWNWLFFYPVERWISRWTDSLITINQEDYKRAKTFPVRGNVEYVSGVGIEVEKYQNIQVDRKLVREKLGVPEDAFLMISVGELNKNKNHRVVIDAIYMLRDKNIYYILCGKGPEKERLNKIIKQYGLNSQIKMLGFRQDIPELLNSSDCFVFPSKREGLSVAVMEAMAVGLPIIASDIRGNRDLVKHGVNGYLCKCENKEQFKKKIFRIKNISEEKIEKFKKVNRILSNTWEIELINSHMKKIYIKILKEEER